METLCYDKAGAIARVTLNRPRALNAVNLRMRDELWEVWQAVRDDPDVRVLVMRGAGERAFSAGADISEFGTAPSIVASRAARRDRDLWPLLLHLPRPTIAAIHGYALGAGLELSLYCDFRIASDDAVLGLPEVKLGYIPSAGGTQMLPRLIGPGRALEMVLSGEPVSARDALALGLVHRVVAREDLDAAAERLALQLASRPPDALVAAKRAVDLALELDLASGPAAEAAVVRQFLARREAILHSSPGQVAL
jgi:enoyl-CoA hydratase/carnithine racemase